LYSVLIEASKVSIKKNHLESSLKSSTAWFTLFESEVLILATKTL
jgi:hypothetical protein